MSQKMTRQARRTKWEDLVRRAWTDAAFKARLLADPLAVLREEGWEAPAGKTVRVVENTEDVLFLTLPASPPVAELILTPEQMDRIASDGGASAQHRTYGCGTYRCTNYTCDLVTS